MGWKSTIDITRREAIVAIMKVIDETPYDEKSNEELENIMYGLGIGDSIDKPYYGHNFSIIDDKKDE